MNLSRLKIPDGKNLALVAIALLLLLFALKQVLAYVQRLRAQHVIQQSVNPLNLSFGQGQYKIWADLLQGMLESWPFVDEDQIVTLLQRLKTPDDYHELVRVFGVRKITRYVLGNFEGNLNEWFARRLSEKEIRKLRAVLEQIGIYI